MPKLIKEDVLQYYLKSAEEKSFKTQVVESLPSPQEMKDNIMYLVKSSIQNEEQVTTYDEYILVNGAAERIGTNLSEEDIKKIVVGSMRYEIKLNSPQWETVEKGIYKTTTTILNPIKESAEISMISDVFQGTDETENELLRNNWSAVTRITYDNGTVTIYSKKELDKLYFQLLAFSGNVQPALQNDIKTAVITLVQNSFIWDGLTHQPEIQSVMMGETELHLGEDFSALIDKQTEAGLYSIIVFGINNYTGITSVNWSIEKKVPTITLSDEQVTIKGVMGTTNDSITITCDGDGMLEVENTTPETVTGVIIENNKVKLTSVSAGHGSVRIKHINGRNYADGYKDLTVIIEKADGTISIEPQQIEVSGEVGTQEEVKVTYNNTTGELYFENNEHVSLAWKEEENEPGQRTLILTSVTEGQETLTIGCRESDDYTAATCELSVTVVFKQKKVWGVEYGGTASTKLTRTDDAALFDDPTPALNGKGGSSPFDNCEPYKFIKKVDKNGNSMVEIPKFWFKFTDNGSGKFKLQISTYEQDGYHVSPAHADRKDGKGERDFVYVGRYHCGSDWGSKTGVSPKVSQTRAQFRTGVKTLGDGWYMMDWPMWATIQMLYLVEFADFDSQKVIGYGCGSSKSAVYTQGTTDSMEYHTGTIGTTRTTYCDGIQYRWIENVWGNCLDWIDGITFSSLKAYASMDVKNYSDSTSSYTNIGTFPSSSGYIKYMGFPTNSGFEWAWYPKEIGGTEGSYVSDYSYVNSSNVVCYVGGNYSQNQSYGLFYYSGYSVSGSGASIGSRPIFLP